MFSFHFVCSWPPTQNSTCSLFPPLSGPPFLLSTYQSPFELYAEGGRQASYLVCGPCQQWPGCARPEDLIIPDGLNEPKSSYEWGVRSKYGIKIVGDTIELIRKGSVIFRPRDPAVAVRMVLEGVPLENGRTVWPNLHFFHNSIAMQKSMRDKAPASAFDTLIAANPRSALNYARLCWQAQGRL
jgi:hypothetical protein